MPLDGPQFRQLFESERDRVHRFLSRLAGNGADADDLLQDAFLKAWRHRESFEGRGEAAAWLMKTAFRTYLSEREKRVRRGALASRAPAGGVASNGQPVDERDARRFVLERVRAALDSLPDGPREAFLMFRFESLSVAEIARITSVPPKTVETRIRRATVLLAQRLDALRDLLPVRQP